MMRWLLTYADIITLLLAMFIILFAISNVSRVKFQRLATAISGGFNSSDSANNPPNGGVTGNEHGRAAGEQKAGAAVLHQHAGARQHAAGAEFPVERLDVGDDEA